MKVTVTQDHIDQGHVRNPNYNPIALAISDIPGMHKARVNYYNTAWYDARARVYRDRDTTEAVSQFIQDHDCHRPVYPQTFEV